jgi:hypothetical protein
MTWMQCRSCSAKFAVGLLRCPQCTAVSELYAVPEEVVEAEQEAGMPKITVGDGASNALDAAQEAPIEEPGAEDEAAAAPESESDTAPKASKRAAKKAAAAPEPAAEG